MYILLTRQLGIIEQGVLLDIVGIWIWMSVLRQDTAHNENNAQIELAYKNRFPSKG